MIYFFNENQIWVRHPLLNNYRLSCDPGVVKNDIQKYGVLEKEIKFLLDDAYVFFATTDTQIVGNQKEILQKLNELILGEEITNESKKLIEDFLKNEK